MAKPAGEAFFLDVNVPMYAAGGNHRYKEPCAWIMTAIAENRLQAVIDAEIVQEILYRFGAQRRWDIGTSMAESLLDIVEKVLPVTREDVTLATTLFAEHGPHGVSARDALHVAVMTNHGLTKILTVDADFARFSGIERVDPLLLYGDRDKSGPRNANQ